MKSKFFARHRKSLPKGIEWMVEQIEFDDQGNAVVARFYCYCFDGSRARRIAKALNLLEKP